jgi:tetratricopeptide (TPR) repeat protein
MPPADTPAAALAERLLAGEAIAPAALGVQAATAVAWALKDACYAAWHSEPRRAAEAADALGRWAAACAATVAAPAAGQGEIDALSAWTRGIAWVTRGQMAPAVEAFDAADALFRAAGRPGEAAQTQVPKIMALSMLGRHDDAVACAERTFQALLAAGERRAAGKVSLNLGSLHLRHDDYPRAATHYREAARLLAQEGDREHSVMADIALADALTAMGDLDEAGRIYQRASVRATAHALPMLQALVHESLALLALSRGHYGEALAHFEQARDGYDTLGMPQHLAIAEKQLGDAYLELHLWPEADRLYAAALPRFEALGMPADTAWTLTQRGRVQALRGDAAAADTLFAQAGTLFAAQGNGAGAAAVALARAELALSAAGDPAAALDGADRAVAAYQAVGSLDGLLRAQLARGHALALGGRHAEARAAFEATLAQARQGQRLAIEVRSLSGLALADQALGRHGPARAGFAAAVARFEAMRQALPGDDVRSAFLADHLAPFRALLGYALQDHEAEPSPAHASAVLAAADRLQSRALSERLAGAGPAAPVSDDDAAIGSLRARVSWLARRVQGLEDEDDQPSAHLVDELRRSEHELIERSRRQRLRAGGSIAAETPPDTLDLGALSRQLRADQALLQYAVHGDELLACVVRRDGVRVQRRLAAWPDVLQAIEAARFQLGALGHGGAAPLASHLPMLGARCDARLRQLHGLVWAPLAPLLADAAQVLLVAPAPLGMLPFAALNDGAQRLADHHDLAWAPSAQNAAQALLAPRPARARAAPALMPGGAPRAVPPRSALVLGESSHLPHAGDEARGVAACHAGAVLRLDEAATVAGLREAAAGADLIHLACHAQFRGDNPSFSALHLRDGALTAEQVETLRLDARVVVLSGCETSGQASGDTALRGDEWVGLVRAFLLAGADQVVASLWPVDDRVTREFMINFHHALAAGATAAAALRSAQLHLRKNHPHPFHWAAFALYGVV